MSENSNDAAAADDDLIYRARRRLFVVKAEYSTSEDIAEPLKRATAVPSITDGVRQSGQQAGRLSLAGSVGGLGGLYREGGRDGWQKKEGVFLPSFLPESII